MRYVSPQQTRVWWCREEFDIGAAVVSSGKTRFALEARDIGFDGYAVADFVGFDGGVDGYYLACRLVSEDVIALYYHRTYAAGVPEVNVRAV